MVRDGGVEGYWSFGFDGTFKLIINREDKKKYILEVRGRRGEMKRKEK